ncbi:MAG: spermidine/putrescine ABC transporter substrate-binding protein [Burkholderiales bacterium]|nr:spermidine/putrescine ABC transporter substrate-binding protein [Burkholderiales bacterium]
MKKFLLMIFIILGFNLSYAKNKMNLFIAVNYLAGSTIIDYQQICNCKLQQSFFNDPNEMLAKIVAGSSGYDVIEATSYAVEELANMGKLQKLDKSKIIGLDNIEPKFLNAPYDRGNVYSIPYAYTPVFLAYNADKMKQLGIVPNTWAIIFNQKYLKKLNGHVTVFSSSRNVFAAALLYLGKNPNSTNINDLNLARGLINSASPYWAKFDTDSYYRGLLRGDIWVAMSYSIDIFKTIQDTKATKPPIKIGAMMQKEGNMFEMDNLVIPKDSPNTNYAYDFINVVLKPSNAYALASSTGSSIPNKTALDKLPLELKNTLWIYPTDPTKNFTFTAYDPKTLVLVNEMWTEIQMECHNILF